MMQKNETRNRPAQNLTKGELEELQQLKNKRRYNFH